jgi:hypothetical protein
MPDTARYCRELETYLCQKNAGHLIRIVGPAFEQVCSWAERGVPLKVAFRGIDRYCERYYAKGERRRPVRIEFCEADVLDAFDEWRRAVGVSAQGMEAGADEGSSRKAALATHIERALARLRSLNASSMRSSMFAAELGAVMQDLETLGTTARNARGEARARIVERLAALDRVLLDAVLKEVAPSHAAELKREAETELAPFGNRMSPEARARAVDAAFERLVREALGAPTLVYDY